MKNSKAMVSYYFFSTHFVYFCHLKGHFYHLCKFCDFLDYSSAKVRKKEGSGYFVKEL